MVSKDEAAELFKLLWPAKKPGKSKDPLDAAARNLAKLGAKLSRARLAATLTAKELKQASWVDRTHAPVGYPCDKCGKAVSPMHDGVQSSEPSEPFFHTYLKPGEHDPPHYPLGGGEQPDKDGTYRSDRKAK
jgi:hypothetical protein